MLSQILSVVTVLTIIGSVVAIGYSLSSRWTRDVPILVNGLIPSLPGAETKGESGTTVYIAYSDKDPKEPGAEVFRGYADVDGRVQASISSANVGRTVLIRVRHAAYKFESFQMTVPAHGLVHTVKMQKDHVYEGASRGGDVGNLDAYYEESLRFANLERERFMLNLIKSTGHSLARIPVWYWLFFYLMAIVSFAVIYWTFEDAFKSDWDSFLHCIYFSAVTITTLGYGDTYPTWDSLRLVVSTEAILGIFLVGFALNSMFYGPRD